ncbi:hypothetical protein [Nocardiopsis sp. NRRL B-16309]|uniref:hypothetical protein n=1 Tax=Nocardiopsis sp. NRRL B-16309 TaxID=1519494 RepID=UPI0006AECBA2|nr:hypothetical protein [Nocardiopsis sp. NRRL B-16309]
MKLFAQVTRIVRDVAQAPQVARQLRQLRTEQATPPAPARKVVEVEVDPNNVPDVADIEAAARKFEQARTEANAAARLKRQADRILKRTPSGVHGTVTVERVESSRQTADLDTIRALFAAHGLGDVPMKTCAPSIVVTLADERADAPAFLVAA